MPARGMAMVTLGDSILRARHHTNEMAIIRGVDSIHYQLAQALLTKLNHQARRLMYGR